MYQSTKQFTKFAISGGSAAIVDFTIYYALSHIFNSEYFLFKIGNVHFILNDFFKACGFFIATFVTYYINKYWTWRQKDKNNKRLANFFYLYVFSGILNVVFNNYFLTRLPNNEFTLNIVSELSVQTEIFAFKIDKILAFVLAAGISAIFTFLGQKFWIFKDKSNTLVD